MCRPRIGTSAHTSKLYLHVHDRKEAAMFSDMIVPIFQWWMLVAHSSTTFVI